MSQELTYSRVNTVQLNATIFREQMAPVLSEILKAAPVSARQKCAVSTPAVLVTDTVLAPSELTHIQTAFEQNMAALKGTDNVVRLQASTLSTLSSVQTQLAVTQPYIIAAKLQELTSASTVADASKAVESVFAEIRLQHTGAFVSGLTSAITGSAAAIGFSEVKIMENSNMIRIVTKNKRSQYLVSEIEIGKTVDVKSEFVGISDGSCAQTMCKYEEELANRGVTFSAKEQKATLGVPQMPFSKKLLKNKSIPHRVFDCSEEAGTAETTIKIKN